MKNTYEQFKSQFVKSSIDPIIVALDRTAFGYELEPKTKALAV